MNDKERLQYYLRLLEIWEKSLAVFFETECQQNTTCDVWCLLAGHTTAVQALAHIVDNLPNK